MPQIWRGPVQKVASSSALHSMMREKIQKSSQVFALQKASCIQLGVSILQTRGALHRSEFGVELAAYAECLVSTSPPPHRPVEDASAAVPQYGAHQMVFLHTTRGERGAHYIGAN